ncbi:DoxX family protein [Arachidicoccus ginsenosidivorans]|uniref:DoxX family protein n=1 Tax=Arachidicoccus ginsenosidivorans TaxID=496057 RepID=UPI0021CE36DD|nr:TQO small subunit DoxD [Arachidicoccus ginsenosidivorans]
MIIIESIATLFLLIGFLTRISAAAVFINFLGIVFTVTIHSGYFMNWKGEAGRGEGLEFFILLFALLIILLIRGGGKFSLDALLFNRPKTTLSR